MKLFIDIETLPTADPVVIARLAETIKPPGQFKKAESIAEWMKDNKDAALAEMVSKTSFDGMYGRIACICYAFDDGEVFEVSDADEETLLCNFYSHVFDLATINAAHGNVDLDLQIIGHNVAGFDLPFLKHRSIIKQVKPIRQIEKAMNAKPWDGCIADTMLMWSSDREKRASMDKLCHALGIEGKGDFNGSMVAETWPVNPQKVIDYCKDDVIRTREIYKRLTFASGL